MSYCLQVTSSPPCAQNAQQFGTPPSPPSSTHLSPSNSSLYGAEEVEVMLEHPREQGQHRAEPNRGVTRAKAVSEGGVD